MLRKNGIYKPKYSLPIRVCKIVRIVCVIMIILFSLLILIFGQKSFNRNNFEYLSKYLSIDPFITKNDYKNIVLPLNENAEFYSFDNDKIVIKTKNEISVFNMAAHLINKVENNVSSIHSNGKYLCVISEDKTKAYIYNSYIKINEFVANEGEKFITLKSDSEGYITSVVRGNISNCILTVYNNSFGAIYKYTSQSKYYIDSCIDEKNKVIAILSSDFNKNSENYEVTIASLKTGEILGNISFDNELPISIGFVKNNFVIISNKTMHIYDKKYTMVKEANIENVVSISLFKGNIALVCKDTSGTYSVNIYAENGTLVSTSTYSSYVRKVIKCNDSYIVLTNDNCIYKQDGHKVELLNKSNYVIKDIIELSNNILICSEHGVDYLKKGE